MESPATLDINGSGPDTDLDHVVIQAVGCSLKVDSVLREVEEVLHPSAYTGGDGENHPRRDSG